MGYCFSGHFMMIAALMCSCYVSPLSMKPYGGGDKPSMMLTSWCQSMPIKTFTTWCFFTTLISHIADYKIQPPALIYIYVLHFLLNGLANKKVATMIGVLWKYYHTSQIPLAFKIVLCCWLPTIFLYLLTAFKLWGFCGILCV